MYHNLLYKSIFLILLHNKLDYISKDKNYILTAYILYWSTLLFD